jgi:tetratricopeptide (TPR) repeat protein
VGLALVLAGVSLLLDEAMPTTFVATAEVTRGSLDLPLQPVAGIWEKMCIVADAALGIDRVLVHKDNVNQAEDALSHWAPARRVKVVGLEFASEAVTEVFGSVEEIRERLGRERRGAAPELASRLFLIARRPIVSQMKSWVGVRDAASLVAGWLPPEATREREKADLAGRIAARHAGNGEMATILIPLPPEEELLEMPRPMRLQHLAQAVQSAADSDDTNSRLYSLLAEEHVKSPMSERSIEDWQLLGAIGRALAAAGDYARAASALSEAIAGSSANHQEHETSFALSELLRVLGLAGDQGTLRQSLGRDLPALEGHAETASISIGFARCAAGRALVQAGASREALPYLADAPRVDWNKMPIHLRLARERWLARACAECGDHDGHRRAMAALDTATAAGEAPPAAVLLARIDRSLRDGDHDGAAAHLEELSAHPEEAHEIARLLGRHERRDDADREVSAARFVAEHYRY